MELFQEYKLVSGITFLCYANNSRSSSWVKSSVTKHKSSSIAVPLRYCAGHYIRANERRELWNAYEVSEFSDDRLASEENEVLEYDVVIIDGGFDGSVIACTCKLEMPEKPGHPQAFGGCKRLEAVGK